MTTTGKMIRGQLLKTPNTNYTSTLPPPLLGYRSISCRRPHILSNPYSKKDFPEHRLVILHRQWLYSDTPDDKRLQKQIQRLQELYEAVKSGKNIRLCCVCPLDQQCHTDTLIQFIQTKLLANEENECGNK